MEIYEHNVITWYLVILNVVAILIYGWDKVCAMRQWFDSFAFCTGRREHRGNDSYSGVSS